MKYFFTVLFVIVFSFLVAKYKILPSFRKKSRDAETSDTSVSVVSGDVPGVSVCQHPPSGKGFTYFEVLAFSRDVEENDSAFAERIALHLARAAGEINGKGYIFSTSYATLSDTLVVLLTYRL